MHQHRVNLGTPEDWTAFGTVMLVVVAIVAALYAKGQLDEARAARLSASKDAHELQVKASEDAHQLRLEQIQPNVVLFMEPGGADIHLFDLVLKNFGQTSAIDVRVNFNGAVLHRSSDDGPLSEVVRWPEVFPVLAPGQEFRISWDNSITRFANQELPDLHRAQVTYSDTHQRPLETEAVLDWGVYRQGLTTNVLGLHAMAKSVAAIEKVVQSFQEDQRGVLAAFVRSGSAKDAKRLKDLEEGRSARNAVLAKLTPRSVAERVDPDD